MGPFRQWPTGSGFEHFYGFVAGETNQYAPAIYQDTVGGRSGPDRGRGLPLHRGHDRPRHRLGPQPEGARCRTSPSSSTTRPAPRMLPITCRSSGRTSTRAGSTLAGMSCARPRSSARRQLGVIPAGCRAHRAPGRDPGLGRRAMTRSSRCWHARWRSTQASWSTPTTTSVASSMPSSELGVLEDTLDLLHHRRQRRLG